MNPIVLVIVLVICVSVEAFYLPSMHTKARTSFKVSSSSLNMVYGTPRPVQIIPSVLPADWANMGSEVKRLEAAGVDRIQFDVMDGEFMHV